jgi:hypothetical protein
MMMVAAIAKAQARRDTHLSAERAANGATTAVSRSAVRTQRVLELAMLLV